MLQNSPKSMLKEELLTILRDCNLTPDRAYTVLDDKLRIKHWRLEFETRRDYATARDILQAQPRIGSRPINLSPLTGAAARPLTDPVNKLMKNFRDRSLLMLGVPDEVKIDTVERFFEGFNISPLGVWHFWCDLDEATKMYYQNLRNRGDDPVDGLMDQRHRERRTLVRFVTRAEALRALREKQGAFLQEAHIELRLIQ